MSDGYGLLIGYDQNGPFIDYNGADLSDSQVPTTPEAILAWAKDHPGKFAYADPNNSGSGRAFIEALPYLLGDATRRTRSTAGARPGPTWNSSASTSAATRPVRPCWPSSSAAGS